MGAWLTYGAVLAVVLPGLTAAEHLAGGDRPARAPGARRSRGRDLAWVVLAWAVVPAVGLVVGAAATWMAPVSPLHPVLAGRPVLAVAVGSLVAEVAFYAVHRAEHTWRAGWWVHRTHHHPRRLDAVSGVRAHPLDVAAQHGLPVLAAAALGAGPAAIAPYLLVLLAVTVLAHTDLPLPAGWWDRVVVTPGYHRRHHEAGGEATHLAAVLPALDVLFGTAEVPAPRPA